MLKNKLFNFSCFVFITIYLSFSTNAKAQNNFVEPASEEMIAEILKQDSLFFDAAFNTCDHEVLKAAMTDDFEFYHDKWGLIATSSEQFISSFKMSCERQATGAENKARRVLIKESVKVYPLNNYGAIHIGSHRFYQEKKGKYVFTEISQFTNVWKKENGIWKMARTLSYDHSPEDK